MRTEEWIAKISEKLTDSDALAMIKKGIPLGVDEAQNVVYSRVREYAYGIRHTCVTGPNRTEFIKRLILTLSCLYEADEVNFFVLSPKTEYGELLRLDNLDITIPFIREKSDLESAKACLQELLALFERERGYKKLFLVLDGLEELPDCNQMSDLEEYRNFFELLMRKDVEIITGASLIKSIFSGYPGAFVGAGNCLVTTNADGRADVTYTQDDFTMSMPTAITTPTVPPIHETVLLLNTIAKQKPEL